MCSKVLTSLCFFDSDINTRGDRSGFVKPVRPLATVAASPVTRKIVGEEEESDTKKDRYKSVTRERDVKGSRVRCACLPTDR